MKNSNLIKSLKQLKTHQSAGMVERDFVKKNRDILLMQIKNNVGESKRSLNPAYIWRVFEAVIPGSVFRFVVRPALLGLLIFGVFFGGWAATVSASYNSLPGDALYSVKIITEKAQLSLTAKEDKTILRSQFAERRLEEMRKVLEAPYTKEKAEKARQAVQNFSKQVKAVKNSLESMDSSKDSQKILEVAKKVESKISEYTTALEKAKNGSNNEDVKKEVAKATDMVQDTGIKAVEVIIENEDKTTDDSISRAKEKIKVVEAKISTVENTTTDSGGIGVSTKEAKDVLNKAKEALNSKDLNEVMDKVVEAKNLVNSAIVASSTVSVSKNK